MQPTRIQDAFFSRLADFQVLRAIFDHLPEVYVFVKDAAGRLVAASPTILARLGLQREEELIGTRDRDVFPARFADAYAADDAEVLRTGRPLTNRLELWLDENGQPDWCVTTKTPLRDRQGAIIGLMGITRRDHGRSGLRPATEATRAVEHLRRNVSRILTTAELARAIGTSERSLNRKINEAFGIPPYELMLRVRLQKAAEALLESGADIAEIAHAHGFCDQSAFTQHFRRRMGTTPKQFRLRHGPRREPALAGSPRRAP